MKKSIFFLVIIITAFGCSKKPVPHYIISGLTKTDTASKVIVKIDTRLNKADLLSIAAKIKADSSQLNNLQLCYLLPGHSEKNTGENNFYAVAKYPNPNVVNMQDTVKDADGTVVRLNIIGLSAEKAKQLLALNAKEIEGKDIVGRFIDDYNHTVIIPFNDEVGAKKELYIIELDTAGKVVSATIPLIDSTSGFKKLLVTHRGDYITIKDSVLTQYSIDDVGLPYNSIKAGI